MLCSEERDLKEKKPKNLVVSFFWLLICPKADFLASYFEKALFKKSMTHTSALLLFQLTLGQKERQLPISSND